MERFIGWLGSLFGITSGTAIGVATGIIFAVLMVLIGIALLLLAIAVGGWISTSLRDRRNAHEMRMQQLKDDIADRMQKRSSNV